MPQENFQLHTLRKRSEIGATGLKQFSGHIQEEELKQLSSQQQRTTAYKEMSYNDPTVGAILFAIEMLIRQVRWTVQASGEEDKDIKAQELVEESMEGMTSSWEETISEILSFLPYGWSWHEIIYQRLPDGRIIWKKLPIRGQDSLDHWEFDKDGNLLAMVQSPAPTYTLRTIPIEKSLLFRTTAHKGNPEGKSILRTAYKPYCRKNNIETYEAIGVERDLAGLPMITVPAEWTDASAPADLKAAYTAAQEIAINVRNDEQAGLVIPAVYDEDGNQTFKFELLTSGGKRNFDTNEIINRYDHRIAMTVLADFILLGSKSVGSFALSSSKTELFATALGTWLDAIAGVFNRHAIPRLMKLNGLESMPKMVPGDIEKPDLADLGTFLSQLAGIGIDFTDIDMVNHLLDVGGLPPKAEEEDAEETFPTPPKEQLEVEEEEDAVEAARELVKDIRKELSGD